MKIGMIYFEFGGAKGIARAARELSLRIVQKGHDIQFYCARVPNDAAHPRLRFRKVTAVNSFTTIGLASFAVAGKAWVGRGTYDLLHSYGNIVGSDVITAQSCHRAAMQVARARGYPHSGWNIGTADALRLYLERKNYGERRYKRIIAVSDSVKHELMEWYGVNEEDIRVIPNGVDLECFHPGLKESVGKRVRSTLGIREEDFVISFVGNEFGRKGLDSVMQALAAWNNRAARLLVVGDDESGPYRALARRFGLTDHIFFVSGVPAPEQYFAASDVFVLPTYYEPFGTVIIEAMACGIPVITSRIAGAVETMEHGVHGLFLDDPSSHEELLHHLSRLGEDVLLRHSISTNALRAIQRFDWDVIADQTLRVYEEIL